MIGLTTVTPGNFRPIARPAKPLSFGDLPSYRRDAIALLDHGRPGTAACTTPNKLMGCFVSTGRQELLIDVIAGFLQEWNPAATWTLRQRGDLSYYVNKVAAAVMDTPTAAQTHQDNVRRAMEGIQALRRQNTSPQEIRAKVKAKIRSGLSDLSVINTILPMTPANKADLIAMALRTLLAESATDKLAPQAATQKAATILTGGQPHDGSRERQALEAELVKVLPALQALRQKHGI